MSRWLLPGSALSGLLAYAFFVLVTRSLGADDAAPLAVLWAAWGFAVAALAFPIQHWVVRTTAADEAHEGLVRRDLRQVALASAGVTLASGAGAWLARERLFGREDLWFPSLTAMAVLGAAATGLFRGLLVARGRQRTMASSVVVENALRLGLGAALLAVGGDDQVLLGVALVLGNAVVLMAPGALVPRAGVANTGQAPSWRGFVIGTSGGQVLGQVVLNGGPVALALMAGAPAQVTGLFAVLALFRLPYTLVVGVISPVTGRLTRSVVTGDAVAVRRYALRCLAATLASLPVVSVLGYAVGPALVRAIYGGEVPLLREVAALVAAGSMVALGTLALGLVAMATRQTAALAGSWALAVLVAAVLLVVAPGTATERVALAFLAAEAVAMLCLALVALRPLPAITPPR